MGIAALMKVFNSAAPEGVRIHQLRMRYVQPNESQVFDMQINVRGVMTLVTSRPVPARGDLNAELVRIAKSYALLQAPQIEESK
jgi:hypothetical protein